jgi:hypothetical protein
MNYFRLQDAGIRFEDMCNFNSGDGGDGYGDLGGLCVSGSPDQFGGARGAYGPEKPGEVVILKGRRIIEIYDGYRIEPTALVARFTEETWDRMIADESAWDYEDWN